MAKLATVGLAFVLTFTFAMGSFLIFDENMQNNIMNQVQTEDREETSEIYRNFPIIGYSGYNSEEIYESDFEPCDGCPREKFYLDGLGEVTFALAEDNAFHSDLTLEKLAKKTNYQYLDKYGFIMTEKTTFSVFDEDHGLLNFTLGEDGKLHSNTIVL